MAMAFALGWPHKLRPSRLPAARVAGALVWAVLAATAVFWALKLWAPSGASAGDVRTVQMDQALQGDPLRLLGRPMVAAADAPAAQPAAASRFRLFGVAAAPSATSNTGLVTLAVDGGPARVYRVGAKVADDWVVQSVSTQSVQIGPAGAAPAVTLDVPRLPPVSTSPAQVALPGPPPDTVTRASNDNPPVATGDASPAMLGQVPGQMLEPPSAGPARLRPNAGAASATRP